MSIFLYPLISALTFGLMVWGFHQGTAWIEPESLRTSVRCALAVGFALAVIDGLWGRRSK